MAINELSTRYLNFLLQESPEFATYRGFRLCEDKLDDVNPSMYKDREAFCRCLLADVQSINKGELSSSERITLAILEHAATTVVDGVKYGCQYMCLNYYEGPDSRFTRTAMKNMTIVSERDIQNYIARLKLVSKQVNGYIELLKVGLATGVVAHQITVGSLVIERLTKAINSNPRDLPFFDPIRKLSIELSGGKREEVERDCENVIQEEIQPAFAQLLQFTTEEYMPKTRLEELSIDSMLGPRGRYDAILRFHCDVVDLSPMKIHQLGLDAVATFTNRIQKILRNHSFEGSLVEFSAYLIQQPGHCFDTSDEIAPYCQEVLHNRILPRLPSIFHMPKELPLVFDEDRSGSSPARAIYYGPPLDNSKPASVLLGTGKPHKFSRYEVMVLMLHESSPGHHFETCTMNSLDNLPTFRRLKDDRTYFDVPARYPMNTAYTEGWGLYCESLGEELKLYENDMEEYWYLTYNIVRSARAVVDTGIHHLGWTRKDAVKYFEENVPLVKERMDAEINRYITWPGQSASYLIGFLKMKELRKRAEEQLGDQFDIRDFHRMILSEGQVPLSVLENMVESFIENVKNI